MDPLEVLRLVRKGPPIVVPSAKAPLLAVLEDAARAFRFALFRLTVAACRTVVEEAVRSSLGRTAWDESDGFGRRLATVPGITREMERGASEVWKAGNRALHQSDVPVSEADARKVIQTTIRVLVALRVVPVTSA